MFSRCSNNCDLKFPWFSMIILIFFLKRVFSSTGFKADIGSLAETIVILFSLINLFNLKILKK